MLNRNSVCFSYNYSRNLHIPRCPELNVGVPQTNGLQSVPGVCHVVTSVCVRGHRSLPTPDTEGSETLFIQVGPRTMDDTVNDDIQVRQQTQQTKNSHQTVLVPHWNPPCSDRRLQFTGHCKKTHDTGLSKSVSSHEFILMDPENNNYSMWTPTTISALWLCLSRLTVHWMSRLVPRSVHNRCIRGNIQSMK